MADDQVNTDTPQTQTETETQAPAQEQPEPTLSVRAPAPQEESESEPESDEEQEQQQEQEEQHTVPHLVPYHRIATAWELTQTYGLHALLWAQFFWTWISFFGAKGYEVSKNIVRSFQPHIYVFFQGSNYPYRLQEYSIAGPGVAPVEWFFDSDQQLFLASNVYNTTTEYDTKHFEWLSGQIKYNGLVLYDITEFIQEVKWAGTSRPSPARILSAWSLSSGIVLNFSEGLTLCTINEDGTESVLSLRA